MSGWVSTPEQLSRLGASYIALRKAARRAQGLAVMGNAEGAAEELRKALNAQPVCDGCGLSFEPMPAGVHPWCREEAL